MSDRPSSTPDSDVYTILLIVACIVTIGSTVYLCMRSNELFGQWNPFFKMASYLMS